MMPEWFCYAHTLGKKSQVPYGAAVGGAERGSCADKLP